MNLYLYVEICVEMCTVVRERPGLRDTTHTTVCVVTRYKAILFTERAVPVRVTNQ